MNKAEERNLLAAPIDRVGLASFIEDLETLLTDTFKLPGHHAVNLVALVKPLYGIRCPLSASHLSGSELGPEHNLIRREP